MGRSSMRGAPSSYTSLSYNAVQLVSFVSSAVVAGITFFFIYRLRHDGWPIPWTFLVTGAMSLLATTAIFIRTLVHYCHTPNPNHQVAVSWLVLIGWTLSFALLSWNARATLSTACDANRWGVDGKGGHLVCRIYKAQYAFALFAFLGALATFFLDVAIRKRLRQHGTYNRMQDEQIYSGKAQQAQDDPWSIEAATELRGYSRVGGRRAPEYQPLEHSPGRRRGYSDIEPATRPGAAHGHDTEYRGRGHLP